MKAASSGEDVRVDWLPPELTAITSTIMSLAMQNLEAQKESIERRKIQKMTKAINHFIEGDQIDHGLRSRSSASDASREAKCRNANVIFAKQTLDASSSNAPSTSEKPADTGAPVAANTVISKAGDTSADDGAIDSKDKRDRDFVYARASYLIREGLAMQGW
jgi:hypothetical protein